MLKTGMRIEGTIQSARRGQGVMRHGKDTIFVRPAMPGEQVRVRIGKPLREFASHTRTRPDNKCTLHAGKDTTRIEKGD